MKSLYLRTGWEHWPTPEISSGDAASPRLYRDESPDGEVEETAIYQPDEKTLVNFDTIFYVDADQFQRTLTLLGRHVTLAITPSTFTWHHGDGTNAVTSAPGAPYPSKDVVHRYQKAHRTVAHSVTIVWTARYRVGNGPWRDVPGSVSTTGPATDLRIAEAAPVLTGQR